MSKKVEIYIRPTEMPVHVTDDVNIRVYYNEQWVSFHDGEVVVTDERKGGDHG